MKRNGAIQREFVLQHLSNMNKRARGGRGLKAESGGRTSDAAFKSFKSVPRAHSHVLRPTFRLNRCSWTQPLRPALGVSGESPHHHHPQRSLAPAQGGGLRCVFLRVCQKEHFSTAPMNLQPPPASLHPMCFFTMEGLSPPGRRSAELQSTHTCAHTQRHTTPPPGMCRGEEE